MKGCHQCASFAGEAGKGLSRCVGYEASDGFAILRGYIRPESTEKRPCGKWKERKPALKVRKARIERYDWHEHIYDQKANECMEDDG